MPARLKSLELLGYKTFAAKTQFTFGEKITAIVGPNGSGKSNIADSIRWVLGEQSYSLLRGKKTEDMIFAGSEQRPRANVAQACVTFDNVSGWLPIDFAEVSIARRAYRDGQNEYLLNGQRTRLRDIAELLGRVGLAERTYAIVGQGLVDSALSLKAEDRRTLFEEAAGIGIYRARREEALRKLDQTQRNLERVHDILAEIRPRLRTLERQAQRASEYNQVKAELDGVLKTWYGYHWHEAQTALTAARRAAEEQAETLKTLQSEQRTLDSSLADLRARISALRAQLNAWQQQSAALRAQAETLSRNLAVADERLRSFAEQRRALAAELAPLEADLAAQEERFDAAGAELARLQSEKQAAAARLRSLEEARTQRNADRQQAAERAAAANERASSLANQIRERAASLARLAAERDRLTAAQVEQSRSLARAEAIAEQKRAALAEHETSSAAALARHEEAEAALQIISTRIAQAEADLAAAAITLAAAAAAEGRLTARADALALTRLGLDGDTSGLARLRRAAQESRLALRAELADIITAPPELETAVAAALGQFVNAVLLDDADAALDVLAETQGRAALLPLDRLRSEPPPLAAHPDSLGIASQLVSFDPAYRAVVESLLGRTIIAGTRDAARQIAAGLPPGAAVATLSGEIFFASGAVVGGRGAAASRLALAREQRDLPAAIERAQKRRLNWEQQRDALDALLRDLRAEWNAATRARRDLQTAERAAAVARDSARLEVERAEAQAQFHREQVAQLQAQIGRTHDDERLMAAELETLTAQAAEAERAARLLEAQAQESAAAGLAEQIADWQTQAAVAERAAGDAQTRLGEMQLALDRAAAIIAARQARINALAAEAETFVSSLANDRAQLASLNEKLAALDSQIQPALTQLSRLETEAAAVESAESEMRANLHAAERMHSEAQLDFARKKDELESLQRRVTDDFGLVAFEYADEIAGPTPLPLEGIVEHLPYVETLPDGFEDLLNRRRSQLRRMGAINPDALNEYNEVKERSEFLTSQVADLEKAAAQLREVIAELDGLMEREFRRTFDAAAEQFKETFARLFGGGSAKLVLTEPDNLATTGIDILARLPGRRPQGLALLSGGERALTASALIFALLKVNPPPFAMLDEVDAALDEANVGRFRDMLVEMSASTQFVVITHNRSTVQAADTVYGISMGADSASQAISLKLDGEKVVQH